jgi:EAL domain-containing protein (putative c-di-GMP-specific phosphodiesterase class I)
MPNSSRLSPFIASPLDLVEGASARRPILARLLSGEASFEVHYQPIVDLLRGVAAGYEALPRLPIELGATTEECLRVAAILGKQFELEELIVLKSLQSRDILPANCFLNIKVSIAFLLSSHWEAVTTSVPDFAKVVFKITQSGPVTDYDTLRSNICLVRTMGGFIAVADAGSGYASLQHIIEVRPDFIKIDASLVRNCNSEPAKSVLIEMIGQAANRLDAWVIANGVETQAELYELMNLEVPLAQGNYLSRPHPAMRALYAETVAEVRLRSYRPDIKDRLAPHIESCQTHATQHGAAQLLHMTTATTVVVLDPWKRPLHMLERHPLVGVRGIPEFMKVQITSGPGEVLHRALTRPVGTRFDPFAVIDGQGVFQGILRVDRLSRVLLDASTKSAQSVAVVPISSK